MLMCKSLESGFEKKVFPIIGLISQAQHVLLEGKIAGKKISVRV